MDREDAIQEYVPGKLYYPRNTAFCYPRMVEVVGNKAFKFFPSVHLTGVFMFLSCIFVEFEDDSINAAKCLFGEKIVFLISYKWHKDRGVWGNVDCELVSIEAKEFNGNQPLEG